MTFRTWFESMFCLGLRRQASKEIEAGPVTAHPKAVHFPSTESTLFHKSVAEFESLQYKPADLKSREDSQREREIAGYIIRRSHGRIVAQRVTEEKVWEREARVHDENRVWERARAKAHADARDEEAERVSSYEKSWERARQQDWDHADNAVEHVEERGTRSSRKSVGQSRLNVETHISPRSKHQKSKHRRHSHSHRPTSRHY